MNDRNETRQEYLRRNGMELIQRVPRAANQDVMQEHRQRVREWLATCWIDKELCADGIAMLDNFKKKWDDTNGRFLDTPAKNGAQHGADSLRTGVIGLKPDKQIAPRTTSKSRSKGRYVF